MKLKEFVNIINEKCNINDCTIITTAGKRVVHHLHEYLEDEVLDIFWDFRLKTEDSPYEVRVVSMPSIIITIKHDETIADEGTFYLYVTDKQGKTSRTTFTNREEARKALSQKILEMKEDIWQIWTE